MPSIVDRLEQETGRSIRDFIQDQWDSRESRRLTEQLCHSRHELYSTMRRSSRSHQSDVAASAVRTGQDFRSAVLPMSKNNKQFIKNLFAFFIVFSLILCYIHHTSFMRQKNAELSQWLTREGLEDDSLILYNNDIQYPSDFAALSLRSEQLVPVSESRKQAIWKSSKKLYNQMLLRQALYEYNILDYLTLLTTHHKVQSLEDLKSLPKDAELTALTSSSGMMEKFRANVKLTQLTDYVKQNQYENELWKTAVKAENYISYGGKIMFSLILATIVVLIQTITSKDNIAPLISTDSIENTKKLFTIQHWVTADVEWGWTEPIQVGNTMSFSIKFFISPIGRAYPISDKDDLKIEIICDTTGQSLANSVEIGGTESQSNIAKVSFTVRKSGVYSISVMYNKRQVKDSPFKKTFISGPVDASKTRMIIESSTYLCVEGVENSLFVEPQDTYGNLCDVTALENTNSTYNITVTQCGTDNEVDIFQWFTYDVYKRKICGKIRLQHEGCYKAHFFCNGTPICNGNFSIVVLNETNMAVVKKNILKKKYDKWFECRLLEAHGRRLDKPKKVYCYISPKQLTIKEFYMKIIPKRLFTFRVCPSTKFELGGTNNMYDGSIFNIDDACQQRLELLSKDRNIIIATFTNYLLKNIGGSETFKDKQDFFYSEIRKYHEKHSHSRSAITIQRQNLLESSIKQIKGFSTSDWCKNLEITFKGEEGLDWGGLRREWFELLCVELFDPEKSQLFRTFRENNQGLVHPNPSRPADMKLKHYELAGKIVGKCLYESALGGTYKQSVKAQFARSFLAQLIGLRINYKYFEQDDPDLYMSKIRYIEENNVEDMELVFAEEIYNNSGKVIEIIDLIPNGKNIKVTDANKMQYLDALAQYKLSTSIQPEVEHFLKGLNDLVPDTLLSIFDENELELLMCGTGNYSVEDLKANHSTAGFSLGFSRVLSWFWTVVGNFTHEEMAKLVQFTTGSSQLPPGGFKELSPKFQITSAPVHRSLPSAHTCFNQLCLPTYDNMGEFHRALVLAINEGNQGFGMV